MPAETESGAPSVIERSLPHTAETDLDTDDPYLVILYNDDVHSVDEVVKQLLKATEYSIRQCVEIMLEAHTRGRAIAYTGSSSACERVAGILRQIRLQVETDKF